MADTLELVALVAADRNGLTQSWRTRVSDCTKDTILQLRSHFFRRSGHKLDTGSFLN